MAFENLTGIIAEKIIDCASYNAITRWLLTIPIALFLIIFFMLSNSDSFKERSSRGMAMTIMFVLFAGIAGAIIFYFIQQKGQGLTEICLPWQ